MVEIKHKETAKVIYTVEGKTLEGADLTRAKLFGADLKGIDLTGVNLAHAYLADADLTGSVLLGASFTAADLLRTNLTNAHLGGARFSFCGNLHLAIGHDRMQHEGPSSLDHHTMRAGINHLPHTFLRGIGLSQEEIETLQALYEQCVQFYSCFLAYARPNSEFADRLRTDLIANNVSCWQDVHDMHGGDFWRKQINEAIKKHDKLIVVCSEEALARPEVIEEIIEAIEAERTAGVQKLFPVRLDNFIFSAEADRLAYEILPARQRREDWLTYLRDYHVPDFSGWKDHDAYQQELQKLMRDLKNPAVR